LDLSQLHKLITAKERFALYRSQSDSDEPMTHYAVVALTIAHRASGAQERRLWLADAKSRLKHGQWLPWLEAEFGWSRQTADNFIHVFERVKLPTFSNLPIDVSALYLIAAPKTPEPVRTACELLKLRGLVAAYAQVGKGL
jgi:Protein of unknown function (DUF3102)